MYSVSAIGSAIGPLIMRVMYHYTKDGQWMGPGSMFILAAGVNSIAVYCAYGLPVRYFFVSNSSRRWLHRRNLLTAGIPTV